MNVRKGSAALGQAMFAICQMRDLALEQHVPSPYAYAATAEFTKQHKSGVQSIPCRNKLEKISSASGEY